MKESDLSEQGPKGPFSQFVKYLRHNQEDRHFSESKKASTFVTRKTYVRFFKESRSYG